MIEEYYNKIDSSAYDVTHKSELRNAIIDLAKKAKSKGDSTNIMHFKLENDILEIGKSIENGLSPFMRSTKVNEEGKTVDFISPDYSLYGIKEFDYFEIRYKQTSNIFLKTEYGLILYLSKRLQHFSQRETLIGQLLELTTKYHDKILNGNLDTHLYEHTLCSRLIDVLLICFRSGTHLEKKFEETIKLIECWFLNWPLENKEFIFFTQFVTKICTTYSKITSRIIDKGEIIRKIDCSIEYFKANEDLAILVCKEALAFNTTFKLKENKKYQVKLGDLYEKQGDHQIGIDLIPSAIKNYEESLKYFTYSKDTEAIDRVSKKFELNKGKFKLGLISAETNETESKSINEFIDKISKDGTSLQIIALMGGYGLYPSAERLEKEASEYIKKKTLASLFTPQVIDKYGNILKVYKTDDEKCEHYQLNYFNQSSQVILQILTPILINSLKNEKISYIEIEEHLKNTWLNEPVEWFMGGQPRRVIPLKVIIPGIKIFITELENRIKDKNYEANFTLCIDSLAIKVEQILRYMSKRIEIPTFRYVEESGSTLTDEKPMSKLLEDLGNNIERDDYVLIKYLLNEKGGENIRNKVAHGLLDADEYTIHIAVILLSIILRLSHYKIGN